MGAFNNRDFKPNPASIPVALNLGIIDDITAAEELFSGTRGNNYPLPPGFKAYINPVFDPIQDPVIDINLINNVYKLLRSQEGREFFTQKLLNFTGFIFSDENRDGYIESYTYYKSGIIQEFVYDKDQDNTATLRITFSSGIPVSGEYRPEGQSSFAVIQWEQYPSVKQVMFPETSVHELFLFRPADFQYMPVRFNVIGGSLKLNGINYPVPAQYTDLTRRSLVSFCSSIRRPSIEFTGTSTPVIQEIFLERGVPRQIIETLNGQRISIMEFERGLPVIQYIDMDFDGRMETIRRFKSPSSIVNIDGFNQTFDYRPLITSSESDWTGDGKFKTGEVYLQDGSVVYLFDMDGSGTMDHSESIKENQE
jgi:hypothetical protein